MKAVCDAVQQQTSVSFVWSVIYMNGMYMTLFMLYDSGVRLQRISYSWLAP